MRFPKPFSLPGMPFDIPLTGDRRRVTKFICSTGLLENSSPLLPYTMWDLMINASALDMNKQYSAVTKMPSGFFFFCLSFFSTTFVQI
jgi:hypothetical protein